MTVYEGTRLEPLSVEVTVDRTGVLLDMRNDLRDHSPDGPEWGYGGSGPAQLALAILAHHFAQTSDRALADKKALALYQDFKAKLIAGLPEEGWTLEAHVVDDTIDMIVAENARHYFDRMCALEAHNEELQKHFDEAVEELERRDE